jgi:hypothetical protein
VTGLLIVKIGGQFLRQPGKTFFRTLGLLRRSLSSDLLYGIMRCMGNAEYTA